MYKKKTTIFVLIVVVMALGLYSNESPVNPLPATATLQQNFGNIPLYFIQNQGQFNQKAQYYTKTPRYTLWLTSEGIVFDAIKKEENNQGLRDVSQLQFLDANPKPVISPVESTEYTVNYFVPKKNSKELKNLPTASAVLYKNLYKGIDLKVYGKEKQIEYDWIVAPGADPEAIKIKYAGIKNSVIDQEGNLQIKTEHGDWAHQKPVAYQMIDDEKVYVNARFQQQGKDTYSFKVEPYDHRHPLIIDPIVLAYSTFFGSCFYCDAFDIAVDSVGSIYIAGYTSCEDFPVVNAFQPEINRTPYGYHWDAFVTKFSPSGDSLVYSTYIGGTLLDQAYGIAVDSEGCAYVTGYTDSADFPVKNAFMGSMPTNESGYMSAIFVTKFSAAGNELIYSTFLGGSEYEIPYAIAVDENGSAYVAGATSSRDFPIKNAFKNKLSVDEWGSYQEDAFLTKFTPAGDAIEFSTFLGGSESDHATALAVDSSGCAYVFGDTYSSDFPLVNAFQGSTPPWIEDVFLTKFSPTGDSLIYSTYLGGSGHETGKDIAVDANGNAYVTGTTSSTDFPLKNSLQSKKGETDVFVTKFSVNGDSLEYSILLGGTYNDTGVGISVNEIGNAYISGYTDSVDFPVVNPYQENLNVGVDSEINDVFLTKLSASGDALIFSTFLGGSDADYNKGMTIDNKGNIYLLGLTYSTDFPLENPYMSTFDYYSRISISRFIDSSISLQVVRKEERTWLIHKHFAQIQFTSYLSSGLETVSYQISRKEGSAGYQIIQSIPVSLLVEGACEIIDLLPDRNASYTYKVEAINSNGEIVGSSETVTI